MKKHLFLLLFAIVASISTTSAAITVRLDPQSCSSWSTVRLWAWTSAGNVFDAWPGEIVSKDADGWYAYTFAESITEVSIIWNNGTDQTVDITGVTTSTCYALNSKSGTKYTVRAVECPFDPGQDFPSTSYWYWTGYVDGNDIMVAAIDYNIFSSGISHIDVVDAGYLYVVHKEVGEAGVSYLASEYSTATHCTMYKNGMEKLFIPSGSHTLYLYDNGDGTIELSYEKLSGKTLIDSDEQNPNPDPDPEPQTAEHIQIGDLYYNLDGTNKTAEVTYQKLRSDNNYSGLTTANIPSSVTYNNISYSVTSIGNSAFAYCSGLTSVTIPNSVTSIGYWAFGSCSSLTSVTIPNSVTSIGSSAFKDCTSLTSVTIGNSVTSIGYNAFQGCSSLTSVTIPNSVTSIGENAFYGCSISSINFLGTLADWCNKLWSTSQIAGYNNYTLSINGVLQTDITIPNSVTSIGNWAFSSCSSLTSVTIPNSVTGIGYEAFSSCSSLTSVAIPNSVTSIGDGAFAYCSNLTSVTIPNSVTSIGNSAFYECSSLTSVTIPNSVTGIGLNAFGDCSSLTSVIWNAKNCNGYNFGSQVESFVFGDGVEVIPGGLCTGMNKLTSVTIPNSVTSIGDDAFMLCTSLTSINIPNSVTSIGERSFAFCSSLKSITIPSSITSIGEGAFMVCGGLTSISVEAGNKVYDSRENCNAIIETATNTLIQGCIYSVIPNSVTTIESYAFACELKDIVLGSSVETIKEIAFIGCLFTMTEYGPQPKTDEQGNPIITIESITCYSVRPPSVVYDREHGDDSFPYLPLSTIIYVPADYLDTYKAHEFWGRYDVRALAAESAETDEVKVESSTNSADVVWPAVEGAYTYELVIKDRQGNTICTLVFNANGQLTSIVFSAPARGNSAEQAQAAGFSFTVTGLESGTTYDITITAKDSNGQILQTTSQTFTTAELTGVEEVVSGIAPTKFIRDGQLFILRDGKTYTIQGQEMR